MSTWKPVLPTCISAIAGLDIKKDCVPSPKRSNKTPVQSPSIGMDNSRAHHTQKAYRKIYKTIM